MANSKPKPKAPKSNPEVNNAPPETENKTLSAKELDDEEKAKGVLAKAAAKAAEKAAAKAGRPNRQPSPPVEGGKGEDDDACEYRADRTRHPGEMGVLCLKNWIGHVGGKRRVVDRLCPVATVPQVILDAMCADGIPFGEVQSNPGAAPGAKVEVEVEVVEDNGVVIR